MPTTLGDLRVPRKIGPHEFIDGRKSFRVCFRFTIPVKHRPDWALEFPEDQHFKSVPYPADTAQKLAKGGTLEGRCEWWLETVG